MFKSALSCRFVYIQLSARHCWKSSCLPLQMPNRQCRFSLQCHVHPNRFSSPPCEGHDPKSLKCHHNAPASYAWPSVSSNQCTWSENSGWSQYEALKAFTELPFGDAFLIPADTVPDHLRDVPSIELQNLNRFCKPHVVLKGHVPTSPFQAHSRGDEKMVHLVWKFNEYVENSYSMLFEMNLSESLFRYSGHLQKDISK